MNGWINGSIHPDWSNGQNMRREGIQGTSNEKKEREVGTVWGEWRKMIGNEVKEHYSQNSCSCVIDMYLLFILWKSVDNYQPLFCLASSLFFPLTLILRSLLNFLYFLFLGASLKKAKLKVDLHTASKPFRWRWQLMSLVVYMRPSLFSIEFEKIFSSSTFDTR